MVTYPLTFPTTAKVKKSTFRLANIISESPSIFTGASQVYQHQGQWWAGELTFVPMHRDNAAELIAFLLQLNGKYGTFLYGDPDYLALGARGSGGGTPLVSGASQTGNTLDVDGFALAVATVYKKNDYFHLGTGVNQRLYTLTEDAITNVSGEVTLTFEPRLRSSPGDNDAVTFADAMGVMRLSENITEWNVNESNIYEITVPFKEALNI